MVLVAMASLVAGQSCTDESTKLTSLVRNITSHVEETVRVDATEMESFRNQATASLAALEKQLREIRLIQMQHSIRNDTYHRQIGHVFRDMHENQESSRRTSLELRELQTECERDLKLIKAHQNELKQTLELISLIESYLRNNWQDENLLLIQELASGLPMLLSSSASRMHASNVLTGFQNLVQFTVSGEQFGVKEAADESVKDQISNLLRGLKNDTLTELARETELFKAKSEFCDIRSKYLVEQEVVLKIEFHDLAQKNEVLRAEAHVISNQLEIENADVNVLSFARDRKHIINDEVEKMFKNRYNHFQNILSQLLVLSQPMCCMCNQ